MEAACLVTHRVRGNENEVGSMSLTISALTSLIFNAGCLKSEMQCWAWNLTIIVAVFRAATANHFQPSQFPRAQSSHCLFYLTKNTKVLILQ